MATDDFSETLAGIDDETPTDASPTYQAKGTLLTLEAQESALHPNHACLRPGFRLLLLAAPTWETLLSYHKALTPAKSDAQIKAWFLQCLLAESHAQGIEEEYVRFFCGRFMAVEDYLPLQIPTAAISKATYFRLFPSKLLPEASLGRSGRPRQDHGPQEDSNMVWDNWADANTDEKRAYLIYVRQIEQWFGSPQRNHVYRPLSASEVEQMLEAFKPFPVSNDNEKLSTRRHLAISTYRIHHGITPDKLNPAGFIHTLDGIIDVETLQIVPYTQDVYFTYQIPFTLFTNGKLNPGEFGPAWLKFMNTSDGKKNNWDATFKVLAYLRLFLKGDMSTQCCPWLVGPASTGKSVMGRLVAAVFGGDKELVKNSTIRNNVVTFTNILEMGERFGVADLIGKRLCINTELPVNVNFNATSQVFYKSLTCGDPISVERKGVDKQNIQLLPFFLLSICNQLPHYQQEDPKPFLKRCEVIEFTVKPLSPDVTLITKMWSEMGDILAYLLHPLDYAHPFLTEKVCFRHAALGGDDEWAAFQEPLWDQWAYPVKGIVLDLFEVCKGTKLPVDDVTELVADRMKDLKLNIPSEQSLKGQITKILTKLGVVKRNATKNESGQYVGIKIKNTEVTLVNPVEEGYSMDIVAGHLSKVAQYVDSNGKPFQDAFSTTRSGIRGVDLNLEFDIETIEQAESQREIQEITGADGKPWYVLC